MNALGVAKTLFDHCSEHGYWFDAGELSAILLRHRYRTQTDDAEEAIDHEGGSADIVDVRSLLRYAGTGAAIGFAAAVVKGDVIVALACAAAGATLATLVFTGIMLLRGND